MFSIQEAVFTGHTVLILGAVGIVNSSLVKKLFKK